MAKLLLNKSEYKILKSVFLFGISLAGLMLIFMSILKIGFTFFKGDTVPWKIGLIVGGIGLILFFAAQKAKQKILN